MNRALPRPGPEREDVASELIEPPSTSFEPDPGTRSGFLFLRIRPDFRAVMTDWIGARPLANPDAPVTPFESTGYQNEGAAEAEELRNRADELAAGARAANQNGDNYLLATLAVGATIVLSLPIEI